MKKTLTKQTKQKVISQLLKLEIIQEDAEVFFPLIHRNGLNSLIIEPFINSESSDASKVIQVLQGTKRLFFTYREID